MLTLHVVVMLCFFGFSQYLCVPESGCVEINRFEYEYRVLQKLAQLEGSEEGLMTKLAAMNEMITSYVQDVEDLKTENNLLKSRLQTLEAQEGLGRLSNTSVGFMARLLPHSNYVADQTVIFDDIVSNIGQFYNADTGVFTAPVKGQYLFSLTIFVYNRYTVVYLMKNDKDIGHAHPDGRRGPTYDTASVTSVVELEKGDRVYVKYLSSDGSWSYALHGNGWCSFTGASIKSYL